MILKKLNTQAFDIEKARENFINGGGLVCADIKKEKEKEPDEYVWTRILLRIKQDVINQIDTLAEKRMGFTRTAWILEAIQEKLKREE